MLTPAGYILMDGTPYDPLVRKQENERSRAAKRRKQPKEQEAAAADSPPGTRCNAATQRAATYRRMRHAAPAWTRTISSLGDLQNSKRPPRLHLDGERIVAPPTLLTLTTLASNLNPRWRLPGAGGEAKASRAAAARGPRARPRAGVPSTF